MRPIWYSSLSGFLPSDEQTQSCISPTAGGVEITADETARAHPISAESQPRHTCSQTRGHRRSLEDIKAVADPGGHARTVRDWEASGSNPGARDVLRLTVLFQLDQPTLALIRRSPKPAKEYLSETHGTRPQGPRSNLGPDHDALRHGSYAAGPPVFLVEPFLNRRTFVKTRGAAFRPNGSMLTEAGSRGRVQTAGIGGEVEWAEWRLPPALGAGGLRADDVWRLHRRQAGNGWRLRIRALPGLRGALAGRRGQGVERNHPGVSVPLRRYRMRVNLLACDGQAGLLGDRVRRLGPVISNGPANPACGQPTRRC